MSAIFPLVNPPNVSRSSGRGSILSAIIACLGLALDCECTLGGNYLGRTFFAGGLSKAENVCCAFLVRVCPSGLSCSVTPSCVYPVAPAGCSSLKMHSLPILSPFPNGGISEKYRWVFWNVLDPPFGYVESHILAYRRFGYLAVMLTTYVVEDSVYWLSEAWELKKLRWLSPSVLASFQKILRPCLGGEGLPNFHRFIPVLTCVD